MCKNKLALAVALGLGMSSPLWAADGGIEARLAALEARVQAAEARATAAVSIHRNSIDTGKMRRSSLDPTFLLA